MGIPNPGVPGLSSVTAVCITRMGDGVALSWFDDDLEDDDEDKMTLGDDVTIWRNIDGVTIGCCCWQCRNIDGVTMGWLWRRIALEVDDVTTNEGMTILGGRMLTGEDDREVMDVEPMLTWNEKRSIRLLRWHLIILVQGEILFFKLVLCSAMFWVVLYSAV